MSFDASRRRSNVVLGASLVISILSGGCNRRVDRQPIEQSAEFGVFFGGQIQERDRIRFELDPSKQTHGFRVQFTEPLTTPTTISWELSLPSSHRSLQKKQEPVARLLVAGQAEIPIGERQFEKSFNFQPGDPLGLWNVRVILGDHVLIDRPFVVESPNDDAKRSSGSARP